MLRYTLFFIFIFFAFSKTSIVTQIKTTNAKLKNYDKNYKNINYKLSKSAKSILAYEKKIKKLDKKLLELNEILSKNIDKYENTQNNFNELKTKKLLLTESKKNMRLELSRLIAKQLSLKFILDQKSFSDKKEFIRGQVFSAISRLTNQKLVATKKYITKILIDEEKISSKMAMLTKIMYNIDLKRKRAIKYKNEHKLVLTKLSHERKNYKLDLQKSLVAKESLRKILKKLHNIQISQKRKRAKRRAKSTKKIKVLKYGKSYEKVKTKRYVGKKGLSPLKSYKVVKKFGFYIDPIYNIKIFNDSISMRPTRKNAIVRAMSNGKVVISKKNNLLGNFIIISHANSLYSVYAHLDKIAPTIKQGKRIKRGVAIGRVNEELMFQITQKSYHINPLEVIK